MLIYPFRGILYDNKISNLGSVYSPPYDIISPPQQAYYYQLSQYNIIRIILNKPTRKDNQKNNTYTRAAEFFNEWYKKGIIKQDDRPSIYVLSQTFEYKGHKYQTLGFIAIAMIGESPMDLAFSHEMTFDEPKIDRERLLASVGANLSCIYTLFEDDQFKIRKLLLKLSKRKPVVDVTVEQIRHRLWKIYDGKTIEKLQALFRDKKVFIADGHHRYEAAVRVRDKMKKIDPSFSKKSGYNYVMLYFTSLQDKGLIILPTHRLLKSFGDVSSNQFKEKLNDFFEIALSISTISSMETSLDFLLELL